MRGFKPHLAHDDISDMPEGPTKKISRQWCLLEYFDGTRQGCFVLVSNKTGSVFVGDFSYITDLVMRAEIG